MKNTISKIIVLVICFVLGISTVACSKQEEVSIDGEGKKIGVYMPSTKLKRWNKDGAYIKEELEKYGYEVDLQYAQDDADIQVEQVEKGVEADYDGLIIASVDKDSLVDVLDKAKEKDIKVLAYDRLIMGTDAVDAYITFDNIKVGQLQAQEIVDRLELDEGAGPFNIELFAGPTADNNAYYVLNGEMEILQKYIDNGQINILSGKTDIEDIQTLGWSTEEAQKRMTELLNTIYKTEKIDAVICSSDSIATGVINAFDESEYGYDIPLITGQDCDVDAVKNIKARKQRMSVFKDVRISAAQVCVMMDQLLRGEAVEANDTQSYNNGKCVVPTYLCTPGTININNYKEAIIDTNYYTEDELR